jgi:glycosyltransferase involved in cell wall biosynthesis
MATQIRRLPLSPFQRKIERLLRSTNTFDPLFYARNNPDVVRRGLDLLDHYITHGERENRKPSPFFDPAWYRLQVPRLPDGHSVLAHYLTLGDAEGIQPLVGFDPPFVRQQMGGRPAPALVGFLKAVAVGQRYNPNRFFDYHYYLAANPDVAGAGIDAYLHFVHAGANEGRLPSEGFSWLELRERYHLSGDNMQMYRELMLRWRHLNLESVADEVSAIQLIQDEIRASHRPSDAYEPHAAPPPQGTRRPCDVYAFYLTQYHRVAENDAWWGEGFTEWHNVVRGAPRFVGHYQPRIPSALGFYDLDDPRVMERQVALAKQSGLAGFAFYYYHFGSQRLLEKPLERFLADPSLELGFFLIWANETWSRRWDGSESEILLEQTYPPDMPQMVAADLVRHFSDPRYRRIDGRPLLAIYRTGAIPDAANWLFGLRAAFAELGENPLIYMAQTFEDEDPRRYGLDGALEFPPHKISRTLRLAMPDRGFGNNPLLKVWDYDMFVETALRQPEPAYPLIRTCFPSWDNDSRRQGAASVIHGSTPELFRRWLAGLVDGAENSAAEGQAIVCINAWNEWGEGAYLEPDRRFGYAYLNTVQTVLHAAQQGMRLQVVLVGHDAFPAGAQRLLINLGRTLKQDFAVDVVFVLLRADAGYGGLLDTYRGVAETHVVTGDAQALAAQLARRGFTHAIVNSSASAPMLAPLAAAGLIAIQLVHELPEMFAALGVGPMMAANGHHVRHFVTSTPAMIDMLGSAGIPADRLLLRPQGQYRRVARLDPATARATLGLDGEQCIVANLGHADRRKGADLFVATAEAARDADEKMVFVWQGGWDPETRAALDERISALTLTGHLLLLPDGAEIEGLLGAADIFLLSSREDPLPSSAIEAWSCGLPVAAIRGTGGIAELIEGEDNLGTLADAADPTALLDAVRRARALGRSDERIEWAAFQFDWPLYVRDLLRMLFEPVAVDVAIVGHNHGRFAESRITSIGRQTLSPRTITYFDIASTDGGGVGIAEVAEKAGVRLVESTTNDGRLFATWAEIAAASDAPYFHIAEGDDWIAPAMIERCVNALECTPGAAYAFTAVEWIDVEDRVIADHSDYPVSVIGADIAGGGEIAADRLLNSDFVVKNPILTISSVVWRRDVLLELIRENAPAFESLSFAFDWLLYLRAAAAGHSAIFIPEVLCRHRQHADSFASRDDMARHIAEIRKIHELQSAPGAEWRRADYLSSLG